MPKSVFSAEYAAFLRCLVRARTDAGLTQQDVAARLKMTQSAVSKCERGERRVDVVELRRWCHALGTTLPDFSVQFERAVGRTGATHRG